MNLLPIFGLVAGLVVGRPWALLVTALGAGIGFTLVAILMDEISGWDDLYVWINTAVSLGITWVGVLLRKRFFRRRPARR